MSRQLSKPVALGLACLLWTMAGCRPQQPFYFHENHDPGHYLDVVTQTEYADVDSKTIDEVRNSAPPMSLTNPTPQEIWELKLEDAVRISLENSKVLKELGARPEGFPANWEPTQLTNVARFGDNLLNTVYDIPITESDPRSGVEGALSEFDAQLQNSLSWETSDRRVNNSTFPIQSGDTGRFETAVQKANPTGGIFSLAHNVIYTDTHVSSLRTTPSDWYADVTAQFRQPLLQGAGVQFNRIAGLGSAPGYYNGVMIARLRTDVQIIDFQVAVRDQLKDVETAYWNLYLAYRQLDAAVKGRNSALQTWRQTYARYQIGATKGSAQDEAQARQQYFLFRSATEDALSRLYRTEAALRYAMGLAPSDGRLIRPADEPTVAKVAFDWCDVLSESLVRSEALRREKWSIKQRELELIAAKNWLLPKLDLTGMYRFNGLGHNLLEYNDMNNAYSDLLSGNWQEWNLGINMTVPIGFRKELAGVRNAQLELARTRSVLQEMELEVSHQIAAGLQTMSDSYVRAQTNFNRRTAATDEVNAVQAAYEAGATTLNIVLDAQRRLSEAENEYYRSVVDYNLAILQVHLRKGSLLDYNSVKLAEGPWPAKAYFDATRRARARDAAHYVDYGYTMPRVISRGPQQFPTTQPIPVDGQQTEAAKPDKDDEVIPPPIPEKEGSSQEPPTGEPTALPQPQVESSTQKRTGSGSRTEGPSLQGAHWNPKAGPAAKFDLGKMDLDPLARKPVEKKGRKTSDTADSAAAGSAVRPASYQEPAGTEAAPVPDSQWKNPRRSANNHEPVATAENAEADRSAPGWKRVQY